MSSGLPSALAALAVATLLGCGSGRRGEPAASAVDVVVAVAAPAPPEPEPEPDGRPTAWTGPNIPALGFTDALRKARGGRDASGRLTPPSASAKEPAMKAWFAQAHAIAEAAELDMTMARSLDDAGLGAMPAARRADPAVASKGPRKAVRADRTRPGGTHGGGPPLREPANRRGPQGCLPWRGWRGAVRLQSRRPAVQRFAGRLVREVGCGSLRDARAAR